MSDRFQRLREAFLLARAEPDPTTRERLVQDACGDDPELLAELRRLLAVEPADDFLVPPHGDSPVSPPAPRIGEFELIRDLSGGRGVVWMAHQPSLDRMVAMKVLHATPLTSPARIDRFHREPMAVARLQHPHIVPVYAEGRAGSTHWFVMQYVDGHGLDQELRSQESDQPRATTPLLPPYGTGPWFAAVARVCAEAAEALQAAHEHGIVHRDIKPANLLLDRRGRVLVADFGIARDERLGSLTEPGAIAGTWHYMSPEQARIANVPVDHRTDIYSLGVVIYELLTLARPFEGTTSEEVLSRIRGAAPRRVRRCNPSVPRDLETICMAAMAREAAARYATAGELAADLRRFLAHEAIRRQPPSWWARCGSALRQRRRGLLIAAAMLLALGLGSAAFAVVHAANRRSDLEVRCRAVVAAASLDEVPADLLAGLAHDVAALGADPATAEFGRLLAQYRTEQLLRLRDELEPLPEAAPVSLHERQARLQTAFARALRLHAIFPGDPEIAAALPKNPQFATADITVVDDRGRPVAANVAAQLIDPLTGMPQAARDLGAAPLSSPGLPAGLHQFVVTTDTDQQTFLRALDPLQRHQLSLVVRTRDDKTAGMVLLPGGELRLPAEAPPSGLAGQSVTVAPFWLDRCEVTCGQYRAFLTATGHPEPPLWQQLRIGDHDRLPVVLVRWSDAVAYAEWAGKRLPTYAEWAIAAHGAGPNPRRFPWVAEGVFGNCRGPIPTEAGSALFAAYLRGARPVDHDPLSCTPEGVFELFGNVEEWTASPGMRQLEDELLPRPDSRIVAGHPWYALTANPAELLLNTALVDHQSRHVALGFRCARSVQP